MIEGVDYDLGFFEKDKIAIVLLKSPYNNIVYHYNTVNVVENDNGATLQFDYEIIDNPNFLDLESVDFKNLIGDILVSIIEKGANEQN